MVKKRRIRLLDILRGFAILGTLGTNIWIFAYLGDLSYIFTVEHNQWWASVDHFLRYVLLFFVNGKFLGLLTIMFGAGLELKYQQFLRQKRAWPGMYVWISCILILEGFLHFMLVMEYDILMSYGITAIIVALIVKRGDRAMIKSMKIVGSFHLLLITLILILSISLYLTGEQIRIPQIEGVQHLYQEGSWFEQVQHRLAHFFELRSEAIFVIPLNIFLFLTGVHLQRYGAFEPTARGRRIRSKLLRYGLYLGVPLNLLLFVPGGVFDFSVRYLFAPLLSLGYLALIANLLEKFEQFPLWNVFEQIGRMALSCYILQNVLCSVLFYGWGLGLGGKLGSATIIIIWLLICMMLALFSTFWLRYFRLGPFEYVRKSVTSFH